MGSPNTIVINGKRYDAQTGRLLEAPQAGTVAKPAAHKQSGAALDGFSRRPSAAKASVTAHVIHSKTERSKTLMRGVVKKPVPAKIHSAAAASSGSHKAPVHPSKPLETVHNPHRAARAAETSKSKLISKFGSLSGTLPQVKQTAVAHLPVVPAPEEAPEAIHHLQKHTVTNPFQAAIDKATSHQEKAPRKVSKRHRIAKKLRISPRAVSVSSIVLAGLFLTGFFVYQNIPNLAMRVAAARSGVRAQLPGYKPGGFSLNGPIKYSPGQISISYRSTTDDRAFQVTQSNSDWNSETLLDNFVAVDRRPYQTYQDKGKTIYIYDDDNATWVDSGVWYQVEGKSALNSDQLLRIANSL